MLSEFLAFLDLFTKSALIFLVVLQSNLGLLICQPGPAKLPAWPLALQSCWSRLQPAPGKAGTFPQHPGADVLTYGWSYASSLSENFFGKGFLAVLFKTFVILAQLSWMVASCLWCLALGSRGDSLWCVWSAGVRQAPSGDGWRLGKPCLCRPSLRMGQMEERDGDLLWESHAGRDVGDFWYLLNTAWWPEFPLWHRGGQELSPLCPTLLQLYPTQATPHSHLPLLHSWRTLGSVDCPGAIGPTGGDPSSNVSDRSPWGASVPRLWSRAQEGSLCEQTGPEAMMTASFEDYLLVKAVDKICGWAGLWLLLDRPRGAKTLKKGLL